MQVKRNAGCSLAALHSQSPCRRATPYALPSWHLRRPSLTADGQRGWPARRGRWPAARPGRQGAERARCRGILNGRCAGLGPGDAVDDHKSILASMVNRQAASVFA